MTYVGTFLCFCLALACTELVKEVSVRLAKAFIPKGVVAGLQVLDYVYPQAVKDGWTPSQLEQEVRARLGNLTGNEWKDICHRYDPTITLTKLKQGHEEKEG